MLNTLTTASFKTRARAVDMLGRQQIAGIPTAISELFKNAHDAYADHVEADFYKNRSLIVVRDDGVGMSFRQFVNNWLTLATDVKVAELTTESIASVPPGSKKRATLGEKGIGRLAIASIGPQVLVLTRPFSRDVTTGLLAAFINWDLFALPGVNLDEIKIPIREFAPEATPTRSDIFDLINSVRDSLIRLSGNFDETSLESINANLNRFQVNEDDLKSIVAPNLCGPDRHGTQFWIQPTDEALVLDLEATDLAVGENQLVRMLIGFTNTMTPGHDEPVIKPSFRFHDSSGETIHLIDDNEFFTIDEFETADHHLQGHFDEFGQFTGTVKVYGNDPIDHILPWRSARGRKTRCGPFDINVAVVQGDRRHSLLPPEEFAQIIDKMNRIGGLYIYKDGIRVLPYGNTDFDFLDIEKNRTKSASYYFFSYRRMFGAVQIDQNRNPNLVEKAGREGFRENAAFREFRRILMNFFVQIAADFFRQGGFQSSVWDEQRAELERLELIRRQRQQQVSVRRRELQRNLEAFFSSADDGDIESDVSDVLDILARRLENINENGLSGRVSNELLKAEVEARKRIRNIKDDLHIVRPRGVGLSRSTHRDWEAYRSKLSELDENVFEPAERKIDDTVRRYAAATQFWIDQRRRLEAAIDQNVDNARELTRRESTQTREMGEIVSERVIELTRQVMSDVEGTIREVLADVSRTEFANGQETELVEVRASFEDQLDEATSNALEVLTNAKAQLQGINWNRSSSEGLITHLDVLEATESELLEARDRADIDFEMAQLGAAIHVINHEFDASIRRIRSGLRKLRAWVDVNPNLRELHDDIRTSFEHLDGYLTMFTPLQRRLYRQEVEILGSDIVGFLSELFSERLKRHEVTLDSTRDFDRYKIVGYPSTFYPVFVNLIDNSLFWLSDQTGARMILLDSIDDAMVVADSGPGIPERDWQAVFEIGFTRKPSGRGLGLFIAQESLRRAGYEIEIRSDGPLHGACFYIRKSRRTED